MVVDLGRLVRAMPAPRAVLEREVAVREGEVVLAKVDVDANQELAARYGVKGIPAVKAFRNGYLVDQFVGAPPQLVGQFLDRLTEPSEAGRLIEELRIEGEWLDFVALIDLGELEQAFELLLERLVLADDDERERIRRLAVAMFADLGDGTPARPAVPPPARGRSMQRASDQGPQRLQVLTPPGRDYWLGHCDGFRVDSGGGRAGFVEEVRGNRGPGCADDPGRPCRNARPPAPCSSRRTTSTSSSSSEARLAEILQTGSQAPRRSSPDAPPAFSDKGVSGDPDAPRGRLSEARVVEPTEVKP